MGQQQQSFEQAFARLNKRATEAFNRGDIRSCVESYSEDATLFLVDRPPIKGRDAIGDALQEYANAGANLLPVKLIQIRSSGDMGVCAGTYVFEMSTEDSEPVKQRGKFVTVFMRLPDGSWKAVIDSLLVDAP